MKFHVFSSNKMRILWSIHLGSVNAYILGLLFGRLLNIHQHKIGINTLGHESRTVPNFIWSTMAVFFHPAKASKSAQATALGKRPSFQSSQCTCASKMGIRAFMVRAQKFTWQHKTQDFICMVGAKVYEVYPFIHPKSPLPFIKFM